MTGLIWTSTALISAQKEVSKLLIKSYKFIIEAFHEQCRESLTVNLSW